MSVRIRSTRGRRKTLRGPSRFLSALLSTTLVAATAFTATLVGAPAAVAAPGTPGVPQANTVVYEEGFENNPQSTPVLLTNYVGSGGETYTANPNWLTACNGIIVALEIPYTSLGNCTSPVSSANLRQLAYALGVNDGAANPSANRVVAAYTDNNPGADTVEFETVSPIPLASANGRFLTFSVDTAAVNCNVSAPRYQFFLLPGGGAETPVGGLLNACTSPTTVNAPAVGPVAAQAVRVGTYTSNGSFLFNGSSLGIRMRNNNGSGTGNDAAFDNIRILDVTPQLDKSFVPAEVVVGGTTALTFTVTNTAELSAKTGWSFTDTLPTGLSVATPSAAVTNCPAGVVTAAPGSGTIGVTGDLAAGQASCTVTVNVTASTPGTYENGPANVASTGLNPPGTATVTFVAPSIGLLKKAGTPVDVNQDGITDAGDTIAYTFDVTNTGDSALTTISVDDPLIGDVTCPAGPLAPGATVTCTADDVYTITEADQTAGSVDNVATASGVDAATGAPVTSAPSDTTTPVETPAPALELVKTASPSAASQFTVGREITYSFVVTNTGNVPVEGLTIDETEFSGTGALSPITCLEDELDVDESTTCSATYTVTQADVDAGQLTNEAVALADAVGTGIPAQSAPDDVTVPGDPAPAIALVKSVTPDEAEEAGDTVVYGFRVTNTGNVTLNDPTIAETAFSGTGTAPVVTCPAGPVLPGAFVDCTAPYTLTQADVDAGSVTNTATASATAPGTLPAPVSAPSSAEVEIPAAPELSLVKSSTLTGASAAGSTVNYSFLVTNTGNVTVDEIEIDETAFSGTGTVSAISCPETVLAPGEDTTCTATYTLTQADVDAGEVTNTAVALGTAPGGADVASAESDDELPLPAAPAVTLVKSVDPATATGAGDSVTYSFLVTNTGNVTLTNPSVTETAFSGTGDAPEVTCPTGPLAPGAAVTCQASYVLTQADVDAGEVTNTATATGTPPGTTPAPVSAPSSAEVTIASAPALSLVKSSTLEGDAVAGETVAYTFVVTNTGNVTVTDLAIEEGEFSGTGTLSDIDCPTAPLAPEASATCTATYELTQADVDAGELTNTATATGEDPTGAPVDSAVAADEILLEAAPSVSLVKSADSTDPADFRVGEQVEYSFVVTNTGNVTLTDVGVDEVDFTGAGELSAIECPDEAASVAPGDQVICVATYTIVQADIDAGSIENTAVAQGTPPGSDTPVLSDPSSVVLPADPQPGVSLVKSASTSAVTRVGEKVEYRFTVTNTGNTTLTDPVITEGAFSGKGTLGPITCPAGSETMVPGQVVVCVATYTVVAADLGAGALTNTATASATAPGGITATSLPSSVRITLPPKPPVAALPSTGLDPAGVVGTATVGVLALLAGATLLVIRRRSTHGV